MTSPANCLIAVSVANSGWFAISRPRTPSFDGAHAPTDITPIQNLRGFANRPTASLIRYGETKVHAANEAPWGSSRQLLLTHHFLRNSSLVPLIIIREKRRAAPARRYLFLLPRVRCNSIMHAQKIRFSPPCERSVEKGATNLPKKKNKQPFQGDSALF